MYLHEMEKNFDLGKKLVVVVGCHIALKIMPFLVLVLRLKSLLLKVKEEREKSDLKLNIQKTKIRASSPITSWQIERGKVEARTYFIFLGSKIIVDSDHSHEMKRHSLEGKLR